MVTTVEATSIVIVIVTIRVTDRGATVGEKSSVREEWIFKVEHYRVWRSKNIFQMPKCL